MKIKLLAIIGLFSFINVSFATQPISVEEYNQRQVDFAKKKQKIVSSYNENSKANKEKQEYIEKVQQYKANKQEQDKYDAMSEKEKSLYILSKNNSASTN